MRVSKEFRAFSAVAMVAVAGVIGFQAERRSEAAVEQTEPGPPVEEHTPDAAGRAVARMTEKGAVCEGLIAGKVTLLQAVARFRELHGDDPEFVILIREVMGSTHPIYPNAVRAPDDELYARNVVLWATGAAAAKLPSEQAAEIEARLDAELARHVAAGTFAKGVGK